DQDPGGHRRDDDAAERAASGVHFDRSDRHRNYRAEHRRRRPDLDAGEAAERAERHVGNLAGLRADAAGQPDDHGDAVAVGDLADDGGVLLERRYHRRQRRERDRRHRRPEQAGRRAGGHADDDAGQLAGVRRRQRLRRRDGAHGGRGPVDDRAVALVGRRHLLGAAPRRVGRDRRHHRHDQRHGADRQSLQPGDRRDPAAELKRRLRQGYGGPGSGPDLGNPSYRGRVSLTSG